MNLYTCMYFAANSIYSRAQLFMILLSFAKIAIYSLYIKTPTSEVTLQLHSTVWLITCVLRKHMQACMW